MTAKLNPQKDYIEKIKTIAINPLNCSINFFSDKKKTYQPGKRVPVDKNELKDYLTVASNQLVFELDAKAYSTNYKYAKQIVEVLIRKKWPYYIFSSGGKGIHIECWFDKPDFKNKEILTLFKDAISYNLSFKHIRFWLWNVVLNEAGIRDDLRGIGKILDSSCLSFDDLNDKSRLLRVAGGRKQYYKKEADEHQTFYKTFIPITEFKQRQVRLQDFSKVLYPESLESFKIDESEFGEFLQSYINNSIALNIDQLKKVNLKDAGGYMNLESIQRIREGLSTGQRSFGSQILAIAMANDDLNSDDQKSVIKDYVSKCSQIGSLFSIEEAMGWVDWVQAQPHIFWNCNLVDAAGLHDASSCEVCQRKHKEALKFLKQTSMLKIIKEVLDMEIIGEDNTKMLMFLLLLSKDFPSKTGKPKGWKILPSDSMSQNVILSSDSAAGKTHMTKKILDVMGEKDKDYFITSRITKSVLNYYTEDNMDKKVIFIEEMQGLDEHTNQLRVWMSEGELNLETVENVIDGDGVEKPTKVKKTTKGQPVFISNQAEGKIEEQLNNRSWVLGMDTSQRQTNAILSHQSKLAQGLVKIDEIKKRNIKDALKQLKPYHFKIPFADDKKMNIPSNDVRARRDYTKFLTLIICSAYLHQYQREIVEEDGLQYIICDIKDYEIAKQYADDILGATFSGLTNSQIDLINYLKKSSWSGEFEISNIMLELGKTQPHWYGQLNQLVDLGYVNVEKSGVGKSNVYSLNIAKGFNVISLPSGDELLAKQPINGPITTYKSFIKPISEFSETKKNDGENK